MQSDVSDITAGYVETGQFFDIGKRCSNHQPDGYFGNGLALQVMYQGSRQAGQPYLVDTNGPGQRVLF